MGFRLLKICICLCCYLNLFYLWSTKRGTALFIHRFPYPQNCLNRGSPTLLANRRQGSEIRIQKHYVAMFCVIIIITSIQCSLVAAVSQHEVAVTSAPASLSPGCSKSQSVTELSHPCLLSGIRVQLQVFSKLSCDVTLLQAVLPGTLVGFHLPTMCSTPLQPWGADFHVEWFPLPRIS